MSYIKISDPNIIDLAAWHQVINVVNQHSDSITSMTNNFGLSSTVDWTSAALSHQFDPASQNIIFGRAKSTSSDTPTSNIYYNTVTFADGTTGVSSFSAAPIVNATVYSGNTSGSVSTSNDDIAISVYNVNATGFSYRIFRTGSTKAISGTVYVNWMAIGPK
jgi:hypothetical protein